MKTYPHPLLQPELLGKLSLTYAAAGNGLGIGMVRNGVCARLSLP
jgi:hypothetical protein